jgi:hypothetical protein
LDWPISSPQMTTMFGCLGCCAYADAENVLRASEVVSH